jgi:Tfp pilus assembly protein PilF
MATHQARAARLRDFFAQDPLNQHLACDLADAYFASGDVVDALKLVESFEPDVREPALRFRFARCMIATGAYGRAANECRALVAEGHDGIGVRHDLAFAQLCMGTVQEALDTCASAVADFGTTSELLILKSRIEAMMGDYKRSAASADEALALQPDDAVAFGLKSLALLDDGDLQAAEDAARSALQRDSDQHEALLTMSSLRLWRLETDSAQLDFERALARHPNSGRALSGYGQLLMLRNEQAQAREVLEHAVRAMPQHIGTWHALAWCQLLSGDRAAAEHSYRSAYEIDRNFGDTHGGLALVAILRGDREEAEQSVKRALRLDPEATTARYAQALILEARGDTSGSEAMIEQVLRDRGAASAIPIREFAQRLKNTLGA